MTKGPIHQKDKTILNVNAYKSRVSKYIKQKLKELKKEKKQFNIALRYFNTYFQ